MAFNRLRMAPVGALVKVVSNAPNPAAAIKNLQDAVNALNTSVQIIQNPPGGIIPSGPGPAGPAIRGRQGEDGDTGPRGRVGLTGSTGAPGVAIRGRQGDEGDRGAAGRPGLPGAAGAAGTTGAAGSAGSPGRPGRDGEDGRIGRPGQTGTAGAAGSPGAQGLPGVAVVREGVEGEPGRRGVPGPIGPRGLPGSDFGGRRTYHDDPIERAPRGSLFNDYANHNEYGLWTFTVTATNAAPVTIKGPAAASAGLIQFYDTTNSRISGYIGGGGLITGQAVADFGICSSVAGSNFLIGTAAGAAIAVTVGSAGNVTIAAPSSGTTLTSTGLASNYSGRFIGSSTASHSLGVQIEAGTNSFDYALNITNYTNTINFIRLAGDGGFQLGYTGSGSAITGTAAGVVAMPHYGAGAATFDASGNISSVSDERVKTNIRPFVRGLRDVLKLKPILHGYTVESGLDQTKDDYAGFSAQNVQSVMPEAVGRGGDGMLTLSDRAILAAVVNAIHELATKKIGKVL